MTATMTNRSLSNFQRFIVFKSSLEDVMMNFAQSSPIDRSRARSASSFDATTWLLTIAVFLLFTIVLYLDLMSPGLSPDEIASRIAAFP
jgi:hypothetical protein